MHKEFGVANLKAVKSYGYMALALVFSQFEANAQEFQSNLDIIETVYSSTLDSLLTDFPEYDLQLSDVDREYQSFLRSGWIHFWIGKQGPEVDDSVMFVFVVDRFNAIVTYHEDLKRLTGFSEELDRQIDMEFRGWVVTKSDSKVIQSFSSRKHYSDFVSKSQLDTIEKSPYTFTKGNLVTKSVWTRYLEPLVIVSAVSTIVYLFFSVRL